MIRKVALLAALLAAASGFLWGEQFQFSYTAGEKYRLVTEVSETVAVNGVLSHRADILNKIAVETLQVKEQAGLLSCRFQTSERAYGTVGSFSLSEDYQSLFWRGPRGRYDIGAQYFMPVVRDVPLFPDRDLAVGETWSASGEEVHDLRRSFGIPEPVHFPIDVRYRYEGTVTMDGRELHEVSIRYSVFHRLPSLRGGGVVPVRITGESEQTYYWDSSIGQPHSYQEQFDFIFHLSNGEYVEYQGTARGRRLDSPTLNRDQVTEKIQKELRQRGVEDATVSADEKGVTLTLQNIQFPPDSALLLDSERQKLRQIGDILRSYSDRDVQISGHTARIPGYTAEQHQQLSEERARAVADFLISLGAVQPTQVVTRGLGYRQPLGDNATEEGRRLNRRVEITILEN